MSGAVEQRPIAEFAEARQISTALLGVEGLSKHFAGVQALDDVTLSVNRGEVVGLVGENGAGKTTLAKIVGGVYRADRGRIWYEGKERHFGSVREAQAAGIVMIAQELQVAKRLSIAENMAMGALPTKHGVIDRGRLYRQTEEQLAFFGVVADPLAPLSTLASAEQREVVIAAALAKSAKLVILDEPTAALTEAEAERLFAYIQNVRQTSVSWIYVTHRLDELERVADRVVVLRDGRVVGLFDTSRGKKREIVHAMIGRDQEVRQNNRTPLSQAVPPVLAVSGLTVRDPLNSKRVIVDHVNLQVRPGEVVGLFGLVGAGRTDLARAVFGGWSGNVSGEMTFNGIAWRPNAPRKAIRGGIMMLTEDRKQTGIIRGQNVNSNVSAANSCRRQPWCND